MHIHPDLRRLKSDPVLQRQAQVAVEQARNAWLQRPDVASVLEDLSAYGAEESLFDCLALETLMVSPDKARTIIEALMHGMGNVLREYLVAQIPFRHQYSGGISVLQLAESGSAVLSLVTHEALPKARQQTAQSICFSSGERHECYLSGEAKADIFEILADEGDKVSLDLVQQDISAGGCLSLTGARKARLIHSITGSLTMLRLGRKPARPEPTREFRIADGALLHRASGDRRESREEMAMALLGQMGRTDAVPAIETMTKAGSEHIRWQALRECLALDTRAGFAALTQIACDSDDTLCGNAGTLRAQLLEAHPQLTQLEKA